MTTFGLPAASESFDANSYEYLPASDTSHRVPNVVIQDASSRFLSSDSHPGLCPYFGHPQLIYIFYPGSPPQADSDPPNGEDQLVATAGPDSDYPMIATQPQTQSQHLTYDPGMDQHLVGCLIPATAMCPPFELWKSKENGEWTIGRHGTNDLVLPGLRLSEHLDSFVTWL